MMMGTFLIGCSTKYDNATYSILHDIPAQLKKYLLYPQEEKIYFQES